jgi:flagellar biosynthetic protein FliQ
MTMGSQAIQVSLLLGAPLLLVALVVGLIISIFQAATQINEQTLSFIPKLLAVFATLVIAGPWMLAQLLDYIRALFMSIPQLVG